MYGARRRVCLASGPASAVLCPLVSDAPRSERAALSREYSQFLVELSIALHKFSMYPGGHPALEPATEAVIARAEPLLLDRTQIAFGIARRQLIIEGIATSETQPVLRRLAEALHRHHLGAVTVMRGVDPFELGEALRALAREPEIEGPLGLQRTVAQLTWPRLRLHPLTFDGLTLASEAPITGTAGAGGGLRGAELWIGLARAAMSGGQGEAVAPGSGDGAGGGGAGDPGPDEATAGTPTVIDPDAVDLGSDAARLEPSAIARAIDARAGAAAYDQVIVGYLLQISRELKAGGGADMAALRRRTARLIGALSPETLRRLVEMGGDLAQRRAFVLDAAQGMAVDAVIDIVRAAADASGQTISHGLVRMLSKLAAHAEFGASGTRPLADAALREQVGELLAGWQLADPNPTGYTAVLQHVAVSPVRGPVSPVVTLGDEPLDPLRLVHMSLEVGEPGPMIDRAIDALLRAGRAGALLDAVDGAPDPDGPVAARIRARLIGEHGLRVMLDGTTADFEALDRLESRLSEDSYAALLDLLVTSEHRLVRRRLLERLAVAPVDLGPLIAARLADPRWFVQRNMLVLLERLGRLPAGVSLTPFLTHDDVRVRHEAIRVQLRLPGEREAAVRAALADGHPRLVHRGLVELQHECPAALVHEVAAVALDAQAGDEIRELAIRALGRAVDVQAVEPLLGLVAGGRTLLGRQKLAAPTPAMRAALAALAGAWRSDPRADALVRLAAASTDPDVRRAAAAEMP